MGGEECYSTYIVEIQKGCIRGCMGNGESEQIASPPPVLRVSITTTIWVTCITRASLSDLPAFYLASPPYRRVAASHDEE